MITKKLNHFDDDPKLGESAVESSNDKDEGTVIKTNVLQSGSIIGCKMLLT